MPDLFLTIKRQYFDQILLGDKKEEYRLVKPYFDKKLKDRYYDTITLQAGYSNKSPRLTAVYCGCEVKEITHEFFGGTVTVYAIQIGQILSVRNVPKQTRLALSI